MGKVTIHILRCGTIELNEGAVIGGKPGPAGMLLGAASRPKKRVCLPCFCYLIEHPQGLFLVDTGIGRAFSPGGLFDPSSSAKLIGKTLCAFLRPRVDPGMSISEQLEKRGIKPHDIDILILSHLDADHVGGLHELRGVRRILLPEDEYFWSCRAVYKARQPQSLWIDMPIERFWYRGSALGTNRWAFDVLGDDSLVAVNLPGHTDGLCALLVRNGKRYVCLASDSALCRENIETVTVPGFCFDEKLAKKALLYLRAMREDPDCTDILLSHDRSETRDSIFL